MPSAITFSGAVPKPKQSIYQPKASVTQTYMIAHQARHKLAKEANRPDHNLFRLVCHANMLDSLIFDLAHAEEQQESYLNRLSNGSKNAAAAAPKKATDKFQAVMEKLDESDSEDESDLETEASLSSTDDDDDDDDEFESWDEFASSANLFAVEDKAEQLASVLVVAEADADELQEKTAKISITSIAPQKPLRQSKKKATHHR